MIHKLSKKILIYFFVFLLSAIVAIRGQTRDTIVYLHVFNSIDKLPVDPFEFQLLYNMDWGFGLLSWFIKSLSLGHIALFFLISALTFLCIAKAAVQFGTTFESVIPYYLGTFFLTQQFMQIRQGLAVSFAFLAISCVLNSRRLGDVWRSIFVTLCGGLMHMASLLPIVAGLMLIKCIPEIRSTKNFLWVIAIFFLVLGVALFASNLEVLLLLDRISIYSGGEEYASARSLYEPANLRGLILLIFFYLFRPKQQFADFKSYMLLLGLYSAHLGIRYGFMDFAILSARLGSALAFAEIFLFPIAMLSITKNAKIRMVVSLLYLGLSAAATLLYQIPFLLVDYFVSIEGFGD